MLKKYLNLYKYIGKYKKEQILISLLCILAMGVSILIPYLMAIFINRIQEYTDFNLIINITVIIIKGNASPKFVIAEKKKSNTL